MSDINVLLGLFDGLHRGHMRAVEELLKCGGEKTVFTFNSASMTTKGERGLLMTDSEKKERLIALGADRVISRDFGEIKDLSPEEFVRKILLNELKAKRVICGENFRFGRGGKADATVLRELCRSLGIETSVVPTVCDGWLPISTTRIRGLIESGDISEANRLLGYCYGFGGIIEHGSGIGRKMGIKTVNTAFDPRRALPKKGVYASKAKIDGEIFPGVTNIGTRPTVHSDGKIVIETHIIGFEGDVYGKSVFVALTDFLREEKRFGGLDELKEAVAKDIKRAKELFEL